MDVIVARQGALDVHKAQVTACVRIPGADGVRVQHVKQFKTTVGGLLVLADWLKAHQVTHVVMEATRDFWKPVWHILEGDFELMLVNAGGRCSTRSFPARPIRRCSPSSREAGCGRRSRRCAKRWRATSSRCTPS